MLPLYEDPWFTFRFADDRLIPRFHLEAVPCGHRVAILRLEPTTGKPVERIVDAVVGEGGWVELPNPIVVRAGDGFIAVPEDDGVAAQRLCRGVKGGRQAVVEIRKATEADYEAIWQIFREVVSGGDAFAFDPDTGKEEALRIWAGEGMQTFVALHEGTVVGSYYLKPNQPGLGSHVANAGYTVAASGRGLGVGRAMGEHSLREAVRAGYRAMQFNFVVSTNTAAVELWKKLGFSIVGTVPQAFWHREYGLVDAHVMHCFLEA